MKIYLNLYVLLIAALSVGCSNVFYQPSRYKYSDPKENFNMDYQEISFKSADGTKLYGWFLPSATGKAKGTIVQFHGNAQNISSHFYTLAWLVYEGYNLFTFDYRGYGRSDGSANQKGVYEDSLAALKKGKEIHDKNGGGKFIVFGQSLGGNIALRALPDYEHRDSVDLLVLDSTFASYQDVAFDKASHNWLLFIISPLTYLLVSDEYAAEKVIDRVKNPVLVIVGQKDFVIPQKFGKQIFKSLRTQKKWLWKLPDGGHIDVFHGRDMRARREQFRQLLEGIRRE